jgi:hypothetical protein
VFQDWKFDLASLIPYKLNLSWCIWSDISLTYMYIYVISKKILTTFMFLKLTTLN